MKPINLKIKGLNSFIEMQEVNFEILTEKGLFGIFGPTGSGKSTILDGITLALYGEVSRKSTNFMNTNCDSMSVSYEFQITDKEVKRYRVDRDFRRDPKTGNVRTKSAIIVDVINDQVLEDKVRDVTEKCEEIIGLKLDDFTRTVVLPQGKFSEFLKLEGRERREMLERLFNLQKYGDELSFKLGLKIKEETQQTNTLEGELKSYSDVSDEILQEENERLNETKDQLSKCKEELSQAEKAYNEGKELWDLQKELKDLKLKEESLKEIEGEINQDRLRVSLLESSLKVKPYVDGYENTLKEISQVKSIIGTLTKNAESIKNEKILAEEELRKAKEKKDIELPKLKIKEQQVNDAIEEKKSLDLLINEKNDLSKNILIIDSDLQTKSISLKKSEENIVNLGENINFKENKLDSLKISEEFKNKVNEGFVLLSQYESIKKQQIKSEKDITSTKANIEEAKLKSEKLSKVLNEKEASLVETTNKVNKLTENCPGNQDTLIDLKEKLTYVKENWDKNKEYTFLIEKSKINVKKINEYLENKEQEKALLLEETNRLKKEIKIYERENLAHILRESLADGETCPVCGSKDLQKENILSLEHDGKLEKLSQELKSKEEIYNRVNGEIIKLSERLKSEENNINDNNLKLNNLGQDYKNYSPKNLQNEFSLLYKSVNQYNLDKAKYDKELQILIEEKHELLTDYNNVSSALIYNKDMLSKLSDEFESKNKEFLETESKLSILKNEIGVKDFKETRNEIDKKEKERSNLEKDIKDLRSILKTEQANKEKLTEESSNLKILLNEKNTLISEKTKTIEEKQAIIKNKVGDIDNLEKVKEEIIKSIEQIEHQYEINEKKKDEIEESFNSVNNQIISLQGNLLSLQDRSLKDKEMLDKALLEEGIESIDQAKKNFLPKTEIDKLKLKIENYNNSLSELNGALRNLYTKINNRTLTEQEWNELQRRKNEKTNQLDELQKTSTSIEVELKSIIVKLKLKNELLKEKEKLDHKMALLSDLDKLFRGKKFVEFVAANQLKYVSIEASKKLKEISGGTYGLEVDENGKFIIRDYKNGGAQRDATTLSGGETFVASLALALALSSQIQLKGTAPLELFFLDEGFGTLDDNLLDIVMDSLERIHHNKLSIGIISHVESIKNRVPVKLIVKPAEAGLGGSKVKIERS